MLKKEKKHIILGHLKKEKMNNKNETKGIIIYMYLFFFFVNNQIVGFFIKCYNIVDIIHVYYKNNNNKMLDIAWFCLKSIKYL